MKFLITRYYHVHALGYKVFGASGVNRSGAGLQLAAERRWGGGPLGRLGRHPARSIRNIFENRILATADPSYPPPPTAPERAGTDRIHRISNRIHRILRSQRVPGSDGSGRIRSDPVLRTTLLAGCGCNQREILQNTPLSQTKFSTSA